MEALISLIGSVGFPIVMCLLMYKQMNEQNVKHEEETKELAKAIENNTKALEILQERIDFNVNR